MGHDTKPKHELPTASLNADQKHMKPLVKADDQHRAEQPHDDALNVQQQAVDGEVVLPPRTLQKVSRVLLPICFLAGVLNYLDRTNLNFAALQINADLRFTPQDYGLAAGMFSLGYGLAHLPSTFLTMRLGARWWYSSITVAWGIVATCGALITDRTGLCIQRFLLGVAEAGAIPSALHLLAQFYPKNMLTKPFTAVTLANVVSVVFAAPLAAGLMLLDGTGRLRGWQWLFILEGVPSVLLGLVMFVVVPCHPLSAWFLTPEERRSLHLEVHGSRDQAAAAAETVKCKDFVSLTVDACKRPMLWFYAASGFLWVLCVWSLNSWMAIIIKNMLAGTALANSTSSGGTSSVNTLHATLLSAVPYLCAAVAMWLLAWSSARCKERTLHVALPSIFGGVVLSLFAPLYIASSIAGFAVIAIAIASAYSTQSVMYAKVTDALDTSVAGVGLAIFNAVGAAIGGFIGNLAVGGLVTRMGSFVQAMVFMGVFLVASGLMMLGLWVWEKFLQKGVYQSMAAGRLYAGSASSTAVTGTPIVGKDV